MDRVAELMLAIHLRNMLVQKGYLGKQTGGLFTTLQIMFPEEFFDRGKAPTSGFSKAPVERFFKKKSLLMACSMAEWNPDRIPDADVRLPSLLGMFRLSKTKTVVDLPTGRTCLEETDFVRRLKAQGKTDVDLVSLKARYSEMIRKLQGQGPASLLKDTVRKEFLKQCQLHPEECTRYGFTLEGLERELKELLGDEEHVVHRVPSPVNMLTSFRADLVNDVCGGSPLFSVNYVYAIIQPMFFFEQVEEKLKKSRNPFYM
ncbi:hypothetical protein SCUCBS95973_002323 [Sporothrix curviconia]|uniref:Uncharacterized protein n=1 Tax=Sporothrix curviconia TaxID=1260050 RepID=A0ABP0B639_9PEZI